MLILVFHRVVEKYNKCVEKPVEKCYNGGKLMSLLNVSGGRCLCLHCISTSPKSQEPPI